MVRLDCCSKGNFKSHFYYIKNREYIFSGPETRRVHRQLTRHVGQRQLRRRLQWAPDEDGDEGGGQADQDREGRDGSTAMQEIKLFDRLPKHTNLISLLDFHYNDRAFWMVMEFCEEGDLNDYVTKRNPALVDKLRLMFECACALAHIV